MASSHFDEDEQDGNAMLDPAEAGEEIEDDGDAPMSDDDDEDRHEIQLQNDSIAHFDGHSDSVFCIASHPLFPQIVASGGGDDVGFVFDTSATTPSQPGQERESITPLYKISGHTDSLNALTFTLPNGKFLLSGGLDGRLTSHRAIPTSTSDTKPISFKAGASTQEVEEINFLAACPHPGHPNIVALGASDGSVWVYNIGDSQLDILAAYYVHTGPVTAGAWTPNGSLLVTVSEDGSLYAWDVFGDAAAAGACPPGQQYAVAQTSADERFRVDGGWYSLAISPSGSLVAAGGADGSIRVVGLPRLSPQTSGQALGNTPGKGGDGVAGSKTNRGQPATSTPKGGSSQVPGSALAGQLLASLHAQADSIETLAFSPLPATLLAAGSVDGSISVFDASKGFALRRSLPAAHAGEAVIKVAFPSAQELATDPAGKAVAGKEWVLTSCGNDGVLRRWDLRGSTGATGASGVSRPVGGRGAIPANGPEPQPQSQAQDSASALIGEWRGHAGGGGGGGEGGGGILGFVLDRDTAVTAGDDGVVLVYNLSTPPLPAAVMAGLR